MLPVNPALEAHHADHSTAIDSSPLNSSSAPTSPKTRELKARYEALHSTGMVATKVGRAVANEDVIHKNLHRGK